MAVTEQTKFSAIRNAMGLVPYLSVLHSHLSSIYRIVAIMRSSISLKNP